MLWVFVCKIQSPFIVPRCSQKPRCKPGKRSNLSFVFDFPIVDDPAFFCRVVNESQFCTRQYADVAKFQTAFLMLFCRSTLLRWRFRCFFDFTFFGRRVVDWALFANSV